MTLNRMIRLIFLMRSEMSPFCRRIRVSNVSCIELVAHFMVLLIGTSMTLKRKLMLVKQDVNNTASIRTISHYLVALTTEIIVAFTTVALLVKRNVMYRVNLSNGLPM